MLFSQSGCRVFCMPASAPSVLVEGYLYPEARPSVKVADLREWEQMPMSLQQQARLSVGSLLCKDLRARIRCQVGLTTSVGVSSSKLLSKLVSSLHKPNQQTVFFPSPANIVHMLPPEIVGLDKERANNSRRFRSRSSAPAKPSATARCDKTRMSKVGGGSVCGGGTPPTPLPPAAWQGPCPPAGLAGASPFRSKNGSSAQTILEPSARLPRSSDRGEPLRQRPGRRYERRVPKVRQVVRKRARNRHFTL